MLVSDALKRIDLALGSPLGGSERGGMAILNEAGIDFFACHTWRFARSMRGRATLAAGAEYVNLPLGCARLIAIERSPAWEGAVELVDAATFQVVKSRRLESPNYFVATEDYPLVSGRPVLRLALDHAPTDTVANAFTVAFEAGWTPVTGDRDATEILPMPDYVEPYFAARLEAYALGLEQPHNGSVSARLMEIDAGPLRHVAIERDMRAVRAGGPPINTAVQMTRRPNQPPPEFSTINLITP